MKKQPKKTTGGYAIPLLNVVLASVMGLFLVTEAAAQVSIAPTSLFFDSDNRFASLIVSNGGNQAQEVSIDLEFGYPAFVNGELLIQEDSVMEKQKSIAPWVRIFPQSFTLQPSQRQVVRFVAQPPGSLQPGGYWSRVQITSNAATAPVESVGQNQVSAQINMELQQVISAHFRTSDATTGVEVENITYSHDGQSGIISVQMNQTGNAPFIGTLNLTVTGPDGDQVFSTSSGFSVYTEITRQYRFDAGGLSPGTYTASGTITSERRDIEADKLLQITPVSYQKTFTVE